MRKRFSYLAIAIVLSLAIPVFAQLPTPGPPEWINGINARCYAIAGYSKALAQVRDEGLGMNAALNYFAGSGLPKTAEILRPYAILIWGALADKPPEEVQALIYQVCLKQREHHK
jgi:hypothetical protein